MKDSTMRMLRQMRCLAPALVAAARSHGHDPAGLERAVERVLREPMTTLVRLLESDTEAGGEDGEREQARAVVEAVRLLARAIRRALRRAPNLEPVITRLAGDADTPPETAVIEAVASDIADLLESDGVPGGAIDPIAVCRRLRAGVPMPERHH